MARSNQQMLDDCDAAIQKAEASQSYTERGRQLTRANLKDLYAERQRLQRLVNQPSNMIAGVAMQTRVT